MTMAGQHGWEKQEAATPFPQAAPSRELPPFEVQVQAPDLAAWRGSNCGVPGFWMFRAAGAGPHLVVTSLIHGNEIAGAIAVAALLADPPRLAAGSLTVGFANLDAFDRFDPAQPTASRYIDEDMNRLWDASVLDGGRHSAELARARIIRPVIEAADVLLDLHSMLWPSDPLILSGPTLRGRTLARAIGTPGLVVADHGHASGRRLIDYAKFADDAGAATAVLVEAGQHWQADTVAMMRCAVAGLFAATGLVDAPPADAQADGRMAEVTMAITACSGGFTFVQDFRGGDVVPQRDTLIAMDGAVEIRTPHDECLLVMPSLRPSRGHTAVRLARFV